MVKLANDYGTLDAVVERIVLSPTANPAEIRVVEMLLDLLQPELPRRVRKVEHELVGDIENELFLRRGKISHAHAFKRHDTVVPKGATDVALVIVVPPVLSQVACLQHGWVVEKLEDLSVLL